MVPPCIGFSQCTTIRHDRFTYHVSGDKANPCKSICLVSEALKAMQSQFLHGKRVAEAATCSCYLS